LTSTYCCVCGDKVQIFANDERIFRLPHIYELTVTSKDNSRQNYTFCSLNCLYVFAEKLAMEDPQEIDNILYDACGKFIDKMGKIEVSEIKNLRGLCDAFLKQTEK
jgi:hypothetical protein